MLDIYSNIDVLNSSELGRDTNRYYKGAAKRLFYAIRTNTTLVMMNDRLSAKCVAWKHSQSGRGETHFTTYPQKRRLAQKLCGRRFHDKSREFDHRLCTSVRYDTVLVP